MSLIMLKMAAPLLGLVLGLAFVSMPMEADMAIEAPPEAFVEEGGGVRPVPVEPVAPEPEAAPEDAEEQPADEDE